MGDFAVTICKEMEAVGRVLVKVPAAKTGKVDEITSLQNDLVGGSTPTGTCQRILTIQVVVQVLIKTKDAALEVGTAGSAGEGNFTEIAAIQIFMGLNNPVQCGNFICAVAIFIILIFFQAGRLTLRIQCGSFC